MNINSLHDWLDLINEIKTILFLALLVCGINQFNLADCDYFIEGICFKTKYDVEQQDVRMVIDLLEQELSKKYSYVPRLNEMLAAHNVVVKIDSGNLVMDCSSRTDDIPGVYSCKTDIGGVNADGHMILIEHDKCIGRSALIHELLHSFEFYSLGINPPQDHSTRDLFVQYARLHGGKSMDTVEGATSFAYLYQTRGKDCSGE